MSLLSLARARRSLSSSSDISELESSDPESDSEELSSALGNAPGTLYARADICRVGGVRPRDVGSCWPAGALVALSGVATRAEYARWSRAEVLNFGEVGDTATGEGCG
jgi:hypothetical protein